jgi:hypothetical protein
MALEKAIILNTHTQESFPVMFNPEEYSLDKSNSFAEIGIPGLPSSPIQYVRGNLRTLKMELFFDTYETKEDIRIYTGKITALLEKNPLTQAPPILVFSWGGFNFNCVLESAGQRFTMFLQSGIPVRATLSVSFKEFTPIEIEVKRGLFITPPTIQTYLEGDTLSDLAGRLMGDPGSWREIALLNNIDNPRKIPSGTPLIIPSTKTLKNPGM